MRTEKFDIQTLFLFSTVHLRTPPYSHKKRILLPYTTLTVWSFKRKHSVLCEART